MAKAGGKFTRWRVPRSRPVKLGEHLIFFEARPDLVVENPQRQPPANKSGNPRGGRKIRTVRGLLPKLYPPNGKVPDSVSTKTVRQKVIVELGYDVSWDTVNRALRRSQ